MPDNELSPDLLFVIIFGLPLLALILWGYRDRRRTSRAGRAETAKEAIDHAKSTLTEWQDRFRREGDDAIRLYAAGIPAVSETVAKRIRVRPADAITGLGLEAERLNEAVAFLAESLPKIRGLMTSNSQVDRDSGKGLWAGAALFTALYRMRLIADAPDQLSQLNAKATASECRRLLDILAGISKGTLQPSDAYSAETAPLADKGRPHSTGDQVKATAPSGRPNPPPKPPAAAKPDGELSYAARLREQALVRPQPLFGGIRESWRLKRAASLRTEVEAAVLRLAKLAVEVNERCAVTLIEGYGEILTASGNLTNISAAGKLSIAQEKKREARKQFDLDMGRGYGLFLLGAYFESLALPGEDAAFVEQMLKSMLVAAAADTKSDNTTKDGSMAIVYDHASRFVEKFGAATTEAEINHYSRSLLASVEAALKYMSWSGGLAEFCRAASDDDTIKATVFCIRIIEQYKISDPLMADSFAVVAMIISGSRGIYDGRPESHTYLAAVQIFDRVETARLAKEKVTPVNAVRDGRQSVSGMPPSAYGKIGAALGEAPPAQAQAAAISDQFASLRAALATIGAELPSEDGSQLVIAAAEGLASRIVKQSGLDLKNENVLWLASVFAFAAADHFTTLTGEFFEACADAAVLRLLGSVTIASPSASIRSEFEGYGLALSKINAAFNDMVQSGSKELLAIGNSIAKWKGDPSKENLERLVELFHLFSKRSKIAQWGYAGGSRSK